MVDEINNAKIVITGKIPEPEKIKIVINTAKKQKTFK